MNITVFFVFLLSLNSLIHGYVHLDREPRNPAFDKSIYEDALNPELCQKQLAYLRNNKLLTMQFIESGMRIPRGILLGNTVDLGNYYQCLGVSHEVDDVEIKGKYCSINIPLNKSLVLPEWLPDWIDLIPDWIEHIPEWIDFDPRRLRIDDEILKLRNNVGDVQKAVKAGNGEFKQSSTMLPAGFTIAVCVPKTCTAKEGINGLLFNLTDFGFTFEENHCRLNNDKPWVPGDYVAIITFVILGVITLFSTCYDIWHIHIIKSDLKSIKNVLRSFSLYTNSRRLLTFTSNPGSLECVDGIRALSMMWVILGHTFSTLPGAVNLIDTLTWSISMESLWITAAPISVDTFFMLSGMLLVYTTAGKLTGAKLLKNLHLFYLNRLLRMFPLLAAGILLQVSILHRLSDGPMWSEVMTRTEDCRNYWWSTLLYIQNFMNPGNMCLPHSWYLAIDMQLYIFSPIVMFWVLSGNKKVAWSALLAALMAFLAASTVYVFIKQFPGNVIAPARTEDNLYYMYYYYVNTLTRASPFFVGMIFGYILHLWRGKKLIITKTATLLSWCSTVTLMILVIFSSYPMKRLDWDNQIFDSFVNAFSRPIWTVAIGTLIFLCTHGYGGPINWFLSLQLWKLPSRLSYGMYIFHFPIMYVTADSIVQPIYFTVSSTIYRFFSEILIALLVSFALTLIIDSPFSTLSKLMLGGGTKKAVSSKKKDMNIESKDEGL